MKRVIVKFGALALALMALLQLSQYSLLTLDLYNEILILIFAVVFIGFGAFLAATVFNRKRNILPPTNGAVGTPNAVDNAKITELGISKREYEVLLLVAEGASNQEIAQRLFISESTVKTHVSNLLSKLDAKRRTHAVTRAKEFNILN